MFYNHCRAHALPGFGRCRDSTLDFPRFLSQDFLAQLSRLTMKCMGKWPWGNYSNRSPGVSNTSIRNSDVTTAPRATPVGEGGVVRSAGLPCATAEELMTTAPTSHTSAAAPEADFMMTQTRSGGVGYRISELAARQPTTARH